MLVGSSLVVWGPSLFLKIIEHVKCVHLKGVKGGGGGGGGAKWPISSF